nr:hypothetical protein [Tanacetum cinerariifolium]
MSWFSRFSWYGGPFNGGNCRHCTNVSFGDEPVYDSNLNSYNQTLDFSNPPPHHNYEIDSSIVRAGNEFVHDPNPFPYDNTPNFYDQPPQHHVETYSCELCGNNSHYGYDCPPWFPLVYEQEPSYNQNFGDNYYPQNSPSFLQIDLCCENCGGPCESFQCQLMNQNYFEPNPNYSGFDQPSQYPIEQLPHQEMSIQDMEDLKQQYLEEMKSMINQIQIEDYHNERIDIHYRRECEIKIDELKVNFNGMSIKNNKKKELRHREQAANLNPPSISITPVLPIEDPEASLIMGDEDLHTIPEKESNEFIKSSVEDLGPIPSEFEDTSNSEFDLPFLCDINPLFDEVLDDIENKDSYVSNLDEPDFFVTPLSVSNEDECFDPGDDIELLLHRDPSTPKMSVAFILEGIAPDYKDSCALGFVHRLLKLLSLALWESDILDLID